MKQRIVILSIIIAICVFFFRPYFFSGKLLFPSNLLVGYYAPWNSEKQPGWEVGVPFKGLGHDNLNIFYPMKTLLRKAMAEGSFPFWTPYNFAGAPLFGDGQSAVMYPLTLVYLFVPSLPDAFSIMVLLVPLLTMLFTYGMLRHFKLSPTGALFGAVAFAFSGFMSVWMEENPAVSQSAIWLPLLIWLVDLLIIQPRRLWFVLFSIFTAIMMSSGFLQICLYELFFIAAYGIFRIITLPAGPAVRNQLKTWQRLGLVALSGAIGLLLVAPYLATTWEGYKLSPRDFVKIPEIRSIFLVQWSHILSLFNPDWLGNPGSYNYQGVGSYYDKALFIGVIPLFFALVGLFSKKTLLEKFFWATAGFTLFMGVSSPVTQWLFSLPIPILSSMLPSRIFYLTSFSLAVLAACVFDQLQGEQWYEKVVHLVRPVAIVYLCIIITLEIFLAVYLTELNLTRDYAFGHWAHIVRRLIVSDMNVTPQLLMITLRNVGISIVLSATAAGILFVAGKIMRLRFWVPFLLFFLTVVSAWYFSSKSFYFGERQFAYPQMDMISELQRRAGLYRVGFANDLSRIRASTNVVYDVYSAEGLNPVFPFRYGQLVKSAVNEGKITNDIPRISVDLELQPAAGDATEAARIKRLINLLSIKYITERKESGWYREIYPTHNIVWEDALFRIWENPDVLPRAFLASNAVVVTDAQKILDTLYDPRTDFRTTAIVEEPVVLTSAFSPKEGKENVEITSYRMNDLTMAVNSARGGLLVLTDAYAPGWHATVDGKETPVYRTDFAFRGVPIEAGEHAVTIYYLPQSFIWGLWGMGGAVIFLVGCLFWPIVLRLSQQRAEKAGLLHTVDLFWH